ncbi:MAG: hypothetical protein ACKVK6_13810, partial [bacterium]
DRTTGILRNGCCSAALRKSVGRDLWRSFCVTYLLVLPGSNDVVKDNMHRTAGILRVEGLGTAVRNMGREQPLAAHPDPNLSERIRVR